MASSWNKAILVEADSAVDAAVASASRAVQEGKSLFQSVIDEASDKLAQGLEVASDAVSDVPAAVGDAIEDTTDPLSAIQDTAQAAGQFVYDLLPEREDLPEITDPLTLLNQGADLSQKLVKTFTSPVAQNFLNDILYVQTASGQRFNPSTGEFEDFDPRKPITEDYFTDTTVDFLKKMAREKGLNGPNQSVSFEKEEVYQYLTGEGSGIKVLQSGGSGAGDIIDSLSSRNPADEVKLILGSFNIKTDENGEITITDMFDYNEWYHPDTGEKWTADRFQKAAEAGEVDVNELVVKSIKKYGLSYGTVRSLGFLLGSKGFEDPQYQDLLTGRKSNISLGNVSELYTSPRPRLRPEE